MTTTVKVDDFINHALSGSVTKMKSTFDTLVRDAIDKKIDAIRPAVHSSIFNAPKLESVQEGVKAFHIKFKDSKTGQWFKTKAFESQEHMTQHFWKKVKPTAAEVQFHGPKGRIAESDMFWEDFDGEDDEALMEKRIDAHFDRADRKYKTKKFHDSTQADEYIRAHPQYGIIGTKDGVIHIAKNTSTKAKEVKKD